MSPVRAKRAPAKAKPEPVPKTVTITPSGIEIAYFVEPKRMYRVRDAGLLSACESCNEAGQPVESRAACNCLWREVPSVTEVLKVLSKDALSWWGMRVGFKAVDEMWRQGYLATDAEGRLLITVDAVWQYADFRDGGNVEQLIKKLKLTVNDTLSEAGDRGTSVHGALEAWAGLGHVPDPTDFPPDEFDYIVGLRKFIDDVGDAWETEGQEVAVGSTEHGFAGRYDLRGRFVKDVRLVSRCLTKDGKSPLVKGPEYIEIPAGTRVMLDAKTSKSIYSTHLLQLEAYEGGGVECGYEPTDMRAVLHVSQHGLYQFKHATATFEDFLAILHTHHAVKRTEAEL